MSLFHMKRPVLRVQLTLLYSGLFIGLLTAVLAAISFRFGINILFGRSEMRAPAGGAAGGQAVAPAHQFQFWPAAIALVAVVVSSSSKSSLNAMCVASVPSSCVAPSKTGPLRTNGRPSI